MKGRKGSFTVEGSILIPILIFAMVSVTSIGVNIYQQAGACREQEKTAKLWLVPEFYAISDIGEYVSK